MWDWDDEDLLLELFNRKNDDLYLIDMDLIEELNKRNWKNIEDIMWGCQCGEMNSTNITVCGRCNKDK